MREREPERPRADGGRLQAGGRRSPEAGRTAGPAPPGRQRRTGYYQRMNREDGSATANQPEAFSSSSGYEAPPEQAAPDSWREAQPDNQVRRPPDAVPSGRRRFGPDDTGRTFPADRPPGVEAPEEPGRLRFTPSDALNEGAGDLTRDNLPTQRRVRLKKEFDEDAGRPRRRLRFEQEVKPEGKRNPLARGALAVGRAVDLKVHQKIHEVEHENVGVEAAHKAEFTAENLAHDTVRFAYRHHKRAPYAKMRKWEKKAAKANVNYLYQKTLQENPELARSTLSRLQQKRRIKKQYQKAAREAKRSAAAAKESAGLLGSAARAIVNFAGAHKGAVAIAVIVVLIVFFFASCTSSCSSMLAGGFSAMFVPSYKAEDSDIEQSELQWTQMETQLQEDIDNAERDHPGYDEYRYELDEIGHDPFQIIAFLSAMYDDFLYADVSAVLREVFDEVYTLEFIETVETRTYTDEDGDEHEYDWYILTTKLTTRDFEEVVRPRLETAEHGDLYDVYMDSLGGHQKYGNPLGFEWLGSVTSLYGYRENPTAAGTQIHRGLDIAAPAGTPIYSVQDGTVIQAVHGHASYGNYILIADDKGRETRYAHCSVLTAAEGQKVKTGDKIAEVGSTGNSTGNHLHIEIKENGQYLNPLYLLNYAYKEDSE